VLISKCLQVSVRFLKEINVKLLDIEDIRPYDMNKSGNDQAILKLAKQVQEDHIARFGTFHTYS
jgi:hypothetical protein